MRVLRSGCQLEPEGDDELGESKEEIIESLVPDDFNDLVRRLHEIFASDKVDVDYVQALMASYKSNPSDWAKFANFDEHRYTRNLVDEGNEKFNLIVLCWNEAQGSGVHDHANAHCFMKVLDGQLNEVLFDWPKEEGNALQQRETNSYKTDECAYICDEIGLHRVENPSFTDRAISLHLYSPPFSECASFDQRTGHKNMCKVTFYSKNGKRTPFKPNGVNGAAKTGDIVTEDN